MFYHSLGKTRFLITTPIHAQTHYFTREYIFDYLPYLLEKSIKSYSSLTSTEVVVDKKIRLTKAVHARHDLEPKNGINLSSNKM